MLDDIQKLLDRANVNIQSQGIEEIAIYCPFHRNTDSASCYINTKTGLWQCFNPACGAKGFWPGAAGLASAPFPM